MRGTLIDTEAVLAMVEDPGDDALETLSVEGRSSSYECYGGMITVGTSAVRGGKGPFKSRGESPLIPR